MIPQLPKVSNDMELPDLANLVAILIKELTWLMNGHIDAKNIQANSITTKTLKAGAVTADKIDVNQLSAITANLGTILAGAIYGVLIQGSQIQTAAPGAYPRAEMSNTQNMFRTESSPSNRIQIDSFGNNNLPTINIINSLVDAFINAVNNTLVITTAFGRGEIQVNSGSDLKLNAASGKYVRFEGWNKVYSDTDNGGNGQTLKQALDALSARISALGG